MTVQKRFFVLFFVILFIGFISSTNYYVNSTTGSDNNAGTSPSVPWKTISKVNSETLLPGDSVYFERGGVWREQLISQNGSAAGFITYSAYGSGSKPLLLGSLEKNDLSDWSDEGGNIWVTRDYDVESYGSELLSNPSFDSSTSGWSLWSASGVEINGSRDTSIYDSSPAGYKINCTLNGSEDYHIQLYTSGLTIVEEEYYLLSFSAKATNNFTINDIKLMMTSSPFSSYSSTKTEDSLLVSSEWANYTVLYKVNANSSDGRITFYLGDLPSNTSFYLDTLSFKQVEIEGEISHIDVGNIIFNNEESVGVKVWNETSLDSQGEFYFDEDDAVKMYRVYSVSNPASYYSDLELALRRDIIDEDLVSYVIYDGLDLRYGGGHGIGGRNTDHIVIRNCDFSYIGGGDQYGGNQTVRYGNAIEFGANASNNLVERNTFNQLYDTAMTNQATVMSTQQNITYRYNIASNHEYCFEYWNFNSDSTTNQIYVYNNLCINAGFSWGHSQRPDLNGRHLLFYPDSADTSNFFVRNNILYESTESLLRLSTPWKNLTNLILNYNNYYESIGDLILYGSTIYENDEFSLYVNETGKDNNSLNYDPLFLDFSNDNFNLSWNSSLIDSGIDVGLSSDFSRSPIYGTPDIGALEYQPPYNISVNDVEFNSSIRIYSDGKYRYLNRTSSFNASNKTFVLEPESGYSSHSSTQKRNASYDVEFQTWTTTNVQFNVTNMTESGNVNVTVCDLVSSSNYELFIDFISSTTYSTNSIGCLEFQYSGNWSEHEFELIKVVSASSSEEESSSTSDSSNSNNDYGKSLGVGWTARFNVNGTYHEIRLERFIDNDTIELTYLGQPVTFNLSIGESRKIDYETDSYYDLKIFFKGVRNSLADIVVTSINEKIIESIPEEKQVVNSLEESHEDDVEDSWFKSYWVLGVLIIVIISGCVLIIRKIFFEKVYLENNYPNTNCDVNTPSEQNYNNFN